MYLSRVEQEYRVVQVLVPSSLKSRNLKVKGGRHLASTHKEVPLVMKNEEAVNGCRTRKQQIFRKYVNWKVSQQSTNTSNGDMRQQIFFKPGDSGCKPKVSKSVGRTQEMPFQKLEFKGHVH